VLSSFANGQLFGERFGEAPLKVLALHGWGRSHRDFEAALGQGFDAVALDLPGFGASPAITHAMNSDEFALCVAPVLDETNHQVVLVGHSHGGRVSMRLAARHPEKVAGVVLVGAPVVQRAHRAKPSRSLQILKTLVRLHLVSEARLEEYRRTHGSADYRAAEGALRDTLVTVINESFEAELSGLRCPVILLWGADDHDVPIEVAHRAAELITSGGGTAEVRILEGVGHLVPTKDPAAVADAVRSLLA